MKLISPDLSTTLGRNGIKQGDCNECRQTTSSSKIVRCAPWVCYSDLPNLISYKRIELIPNRLSNLNLATIFNLFCQIITTLSGESEVSPWRKQKYLLANFPKEKSSTKWNSFPGAGTETLTLDLVLGKDAL